MDLNHGALPCQGTLSAAPAFVGGMRPRTSVDRTPQLMTEMYPGLGSARSVSRDE